MSYCCYRGVVTILADRLIGECGGDAEAIDSAIFDTAWEWVTEIRAQEWLPRFRRLVGEPSLLELGLDVRDVRDASGWRLDWLAAHWMEHDLRREIARQQASLRACRGVRS